MILLDTFNIYFPYQNKCIDLFILLGFIFVFILNFEIYFLKNLFFPILLEYQKIYVSLFGLVLIMLYLLYQVYLLYK